MGVGDIDWTAVGTISAAIATAVAAIAAWRAASHSAAIAERDERRWEAEQRAKLSAGVTGQYARIGDHTALVVINTGPATATELRLDVEPIPARLDPDALPSTLAPGMTVEIDYFHSDGLGDRRTTLSWIDGAGDPRSVEVPSRLVTLAPGKSWRELQAELRAIELGNM